MSGDAEHRDVPDLRMPLLGVAAWVGGLAGHLLPAGVTVAGVAGGRWACSSVARRLHRRRAVTLCGVLLVFAAVAASALLRQAQVEHDPVAALAGEGAVATLELTVTSDPRVVRREVRRQVLVRGPVTEVAGRGRAHALARPCWCSPTTPGPGSSWGAGCGPSGGSRRRTVSGVAAVVPPRGTRSWSAGPARGGAARTPCASSLRDSVAHRPPSQRALVPGPGRRRRRRARPATSPTTSATTGLTHLLAVSGTNLTLVVGFLLVLARWCGVRGRWLYVVGAVGIVGFVLLARTEPSVVRAAAMGTVALLAMGTDGRQRGTRALGVAVVALLLLDPRLAVTRRASRCRCSRPPASCCSPRAGGTPWHGGCRAGWRRRSRSRPPPSWPARRWWPRSRARSAWSRSSPTSRSAPAVGPATVLGLAGGLVGLVWPAAGGVLGTLRGRGAWRGSSTVARHGAAAARRRPSDWGTGVLALAVLTALAVLVALVGAVPAAAPTDGPGLLRRAGRRRAGPAADAGLAAAGLGARRLRRRPGRRAGAATPAPGAGVVVDAGPDPAAVDECLRPAGRRPGAAGAC